MVRNAVMRGEFEKGTKVVHKSHGVGTIHGIETMNLGGVSQDFYLLKIDSTGLEVRFPKVGQSNIVRNLIDEEGISKVFGTLSSPPKNYSMVWNRRKKNFLEKIKSGNLIEIAEVLRDLSRLSSSKELSFGEKEMLEKARTRLINEISAAKGESFEAVDEQVTDLLS